MTKYNFDRLLKTIDVNWQLVDDNKNLPEGKQEERLEQRRRRAEEFMTHVEGIFYADEGFGRVGPDHLILQEIMDVLGATLADLNKKWKGE